MAIMDWLLNLRQRLRGDEITPEDFALELDDWGEIEARLMNGQVDRVEEPAAVEPRSARRPRRKTKPVRPRKVAV